MFDVDDSRQTFASVITGEVGVGVLEEVVFSGVIID